MLFVDSIVGNVNEPEWSSRLTGIDLDILELDQWEARNNQLRKLTRKGADVALLLDRYQQLRDGDIVSWNEATSSAIVVRIQLQDLLVIRLDAVLAESAEVLAGVCFGLGHAFGNQHWPVVSKGATIYVPLAADHGALASVMKTFAFSGITYEFVSGKQIIPLLTPHEARRLFGGANISPHDHASDLPVRNVADETPVSPPAPDENRDARA